jgi:hypothetical protein
MNKKLLVLILPFLWVVTQSYLCGATIPAGTSVTVRTGAAISSHEKAGRTFTAKLDQNVVVGGNVLLQAGTQFLGVVEASRAQSRTSSSPLTLNLTGVSIGGRTVPIKTTGGFQPQTRTKTTRQSRANVSVGESTFPSGMRMEFRLAQPLNI